VQQNVAVDSLSLRPNRSFYLADSCRDLQEKTLPVGWCICIVYGLRLRNSRATQVENRISRLSEAGQWTNLRDVAGRVWGKTIVHRTPAIVSGKVLRARIARYIGSITSATPCAATRMNMTGRIANMAVLRPSHSRVDLTQQLRL